MTTLSPEQAMEEAIKLSASSLQNTGTPCGGPFGAVICQNGELIAGGFNHVLSNHDPSAHGEVQAIRAACHKLKTWDLSGCIPAVNLARCA